MLHLSLFDKQFKNRIIKKIFFYNVGRVVNMGVDPVDNTITNKPH